MQIFNEKDQFKVFATETNILSVNEAALLVSIQPPISVSLWAQANECYNCDLQEVPDVSYENRIFCKFDTQLTWSLAVFSQNHSRLCETMNVKFEEHGLYSFNYNQNNCSDVFVLEFPINPYAPIFVMVILFITFFISSRIVRMIVKRIPRLHRTLPTASDVLNDLGSPEEATQLVGHSSPTDAQIIGRQHRIRSIDVFRGIAIASMIFVDYGGGNYWFMKHSSWNGLTFADVVFPWFAWIMGTSLAIKVKSDLRKGLHRKSVISKLCYRSISLILLGIMLTNYGNDNLNTMRIPGVLQRLGVSYLVVGLLEAVIMTPQLETQCTNLVDLVESWRQWIVVIVLVFLHTGITFFMPVPNCPTGYLGPGGISEHSLYYNCTGGAAGYLDRLVFTEDHIYSRATCQKLYQCPMPYDPEGLLGILNFVLCVYLGVHAGRILQIFRRTKERITRWISYSLATLFVGGLLSGFSINEGFIPINKNLWSLSFVMVCSGLSFVLLSFLYVFVDTKNWWKGSPFYQAGMNSLVLYIGHIIFKNTFPWQWKPYFPAFHAEYLLMDIWAVALWMIFAVILYKKRIFITL